MLKFIFVFFASLILHTTAGCKKTEKITDQFCTIGSEEFNSVTDTWIANFDSDGPVHEGRGNATGPMGLSEGVCEMAAMTRPMTDSEFDNIKSRTGNEPAALPVAVEAIAIISHKKNPVKELSQDDVITIFTDPDNFSKKDISIFGINSATDRYRFFKNNILKNKNISDKINEIAGPLELVDLTAKTPMSFGYARPAETTSNVNIIAIRNSASTAVLPDRISVQNGKYPFVRYYYIYIRTDRALSDKTEKFIQYILSERGQSALIPHGLYPVSDAEKKSNLEKINNIKK